MKIAVIDHIINPGGGARVVRSLLSALKRARPDLDITFYGSEHGIKREGIEELAESCGITLKTLSSMTFAGKDLFKIRGSRHVISLLQRKFKRIFSPLPYSVSGLLHKELEAKIQGYDLALFTWPFHLKCPDLDCPMVGIFHDFNFRYFFGGGPLAPWIYDFLMRETPILLDRMIPIVLTEHSRSEVKKFYPGVKDKARVIEVAAPASPDPLPEEVVRAVLEKFKIPKEYLLVPTNHSVHKNSGALMAAFARLKNRGYSPALVFVGVGTEGYNGRACFESEERGCTPQNVFGLGYVSHTEIEALIQAAVMVVNPSLYEGGNCPGFDAWIRGVPVAMSNIPPFLEHMQFHDVRAAVFDPRNTDDIEEKIAALLDNPALMQENAVHSREAMCRYTWDKAAERYLQLFDEAIGVIK